MTNSDPQSLTVGTGRTGASAAVFSAFASPLTLLLLFSSSASVVIAAAAGTPLGSYLGMGGILVGGFMLFGLGALFTTTSASLYVLTAWAGAFALFSALSSSVREKIAGTYLSGLEQTLSPLSWSYLPLLVFSACLGAIVSVILVRRWQKMSSRFAEPLTLQTKNTQTSVISVLLSSLLVAGLWATIMNQAPTDLSGYVLYGPRGLDVSPSSGLDVLASCILVFALAVSTAYSTIGVVFGATVFMVAPGLFFFPAWATLSGHVATPTSSPDTMIALASPIIAALGATLIGNTVPIHYLRRAGWNPLTESVRQSQNTGDSK